MSLKSRSATEAQQTCSGGSHALWAVSKFGVVPVDRQVMAALEYGYVDLAACAESSRQRMPDSSALCMVAMSDSFQCMVAMLEPVSHGLMIEGVLRRCTATLMMSLIFIA